MDFTNYKFRASQCHKLMVGTIIPKSEYQSHLDKIQDQIDNLIAQKQTGINPASGRKVKWTPTKEDDLKKLNEKLKVPYYDHFPESFKSELKKIKRSEMYGRNFDFTNKFVQKGITVENESIGIFSRYRSDVLGINDFLINNKQRLENDFVSGEADLTDTNDFSNCNEGWDIKSSWELDTFPFKDDVLDFQYQIQNQVYMWLSGAEKWSTAYVLTNITEHLLNNEKNKWYYALNLHTKEQLPEEELNAALEVESRKYKELEKRYIFNYKEFKQKYGGHLLEHKQSEWAFDIPLKDRVVIKECFYDQSIIDRLKERIEIAREYLNHIE